MPTFNFYRSVRHTVILAGTGIAVAFISLSSCGTDEVPNNGINTLTEDEKRDGWELVFDGESLEGWRGLNMEEVPEKHWVVEDETLRKIPQDSIQVEPEAGRPPRLDLLLDRPLHNFEFAFEWKISSGGNSGIKYNVTEELSELEGFHRALGFEYQILDDPEYPQIEDNPSWATAGLYELVEPGSNAQLNPVGEWNSGRFLFDGNYGEHWLNGERVLSYELNSPEMNSALAESKWADIEGFAQRHENAYITLQFHTGAVWFRNLKLREIQ